MNPDTRQSPLPDSPQSILVVENEHLAAMHLVRCIEQIGVEIVGPAPSAEKALELVASEKPDLAIVDIRIPGVDGLELAQTLYNDHNLPVIILSAFSDPHYVQQASATGVFGYLLKPAMMDDLRVNIAIAWSNYTLVCQLNDQIAQLRDQLDKNT